MAEGVTTKFIDSLKCSICLDTFKEPKILPCTHDHVYCQKCLEKLVQRDHCDSLSVVCPTCCQVTSIPATGPAGLQGDFRSSFLLGTLGELQRGLADMDSRPIVPQPLDFCSEHTTTEVRLYCEQCSELVCYKCIESGAKHCGHGCNGISKAFQRFQDKITALLQPMQEKMATFEKVLKEVDKHCSEISHHRAALTAKIRKTSKELHEFIDKREHDLMNQLDLITRRKLKSFAIQREQIDALQVCLRASINSANEILTVDNPSKALTSKMCMLEEIKMQSEQFVFTPVTEADMTFSILADVTAACQNYGAVCSPNSLDPSRCYVSGRGAAIVGERATVDFNAVSYKGGPYEAVIPSASFKVECVSMLLGRNVECNLEHTGQGVYEITYQPVVKGRHKLHVKADGQHIHGSPFDIAVKSQSVYNLGNPIQTLNHLGEPRGVAINSHGEVVVAEFSKNRVSVYSACGDKLLSFGSPGSEDGEFQNLSSVAVDNEDNILVADQLNHRIQKFAANGHFLKAVGSKSNGGLKFLQPSGIAYNSSNGKVYVTDRNHKVQVLDKDLTFSAGFGKKGKGRGQFDVPLGIATDLTGKVYVADSGNHRIQVFTAEGKFLRMFGRQGAGRGELDQPCGVAIDAEGCVHVSEYKNHRVLVFTSEGEFMTSFTGGEEDEQKLNGPRGLTVDNYGVVYVCNSLNSNILVF